MMSRSGSALPPLQGELAAITKEVEAIRRTVVERAQLRNKYGISHLRNAFIIINIIMFRPNNSFLSLL